jgi:hypothetical protein
MWSVIEVIETGLVRDMQAVELATFKISNMNRAIDGSGGEVFVDLLSPGNGSGFTLTNTPSASAIESVPLKNVYQPNSPVADMNGYVQYMDVDLAAEMIEITLHKRSYELGVKLFNSAKAMSEKALDIGRQ